MSDNIDIPQQDNFLEHFLIEHPEKQFADFSNLNIDSIEDSSKDSSIPVEFIAAFGILACTWGIIRFIYYKKKEEIGYNSVIGDIELIE